MRLPFLLLLSLLGGGGTLANFMNLINVSVDSAGLGISNWHHPFLPDLSEDLIRGQVGVDGPIQCTKDQPCLDGSCCNSDNKCGFMKIHCKPDPPLTCLSNCDAKAMCGVDSKNGNQKCGLNICCSYYGWCGTNTTHCGDKDEEGHSTPCQKDFGKCEVVPSPSCGQGSGSASNGRRVAYYQGWNTRQRQCNRIWPESINTTGLTHLNFAFASIDRKTFEITPMHYEDVNLYPRFTGLKTSTLQTWIAVGGWEFSDPGPTRTTWSDMVSTKENRAKFVNSAVRFMDRYGFQGLDLDWEYPGTEERGGNEDRDTENQVALVVELRKAFGDKYGLSSILAPDFWYLRKMDPRAMQDQVDFFNFMGYDLHGAWDASIGTIGAKIRPHTDIREIDKGLIPLWFNGVDPKKVNLGMALYGRGYTAKPDCLQFGCEFSGPNAKLACTNFDGFMSNYEIRNLIKSKGLTPELMKDAMVKQIAWDDQWVGYDDAETFAMKTAFANDRCLGGTMVWAIDYDSGLGSGDKPNLGDTNHTGDSFQNDVYFKPDVYTKQNPTLQCIPPCTLVLPPFSLPSMTTISWPPITTTLLSIDGGQTTTFTSSLDTIVNGVVTKTVLTMFTVNGGTEKIITTTISVASLTTDKINFWPISVDVTDNGNSTVVPVPSVMPESFLITLGPGTFSLFPSIYPQYSSMIPTASPTSGRDVGYLLPWGSQSHSVYVHPQPTVFFSLPSSSDCEKTTALSCFPSMIIYSEDEPTATCPPNDSRCGNKDCDRFGCGCGSEFLTIDEAGKCRLIPDDESDDEDPDDDPSPPGPPPDKDDPTDDNNKKDPKDPKHGGGKRGGGGKRCVGICPPHLPSLHVHPGFCGAGGCGGGCGWGGCGGGCGIQGCGGKCLNGKCNSCPVNECGGEGCKGNACNPPPGTPTGGPDDNDKPKCDEDKKTTVTDYLVSCSVYNPTSTSCTTKFSVTKTGCGLTPSTTTTRNAACTKASLSLDEDEGDNDGGPPVEPTNSPEPTQPPSTQPPPPPSPTSEPPSEPTAPIWQWRLKIHQAMDREWSGIWWTLIQSNGKEAGSGQGSPIKCEINDPDPPEKCFNYWMDLQVKNPTNKDNTGVAFSYAPAPPDGCIAKWWTGTTGKNGDKPGYKDCGFGWGGTEQKPGCDDVTKIEWKPKGAGFERFFNCWFPHIYLPRLAMAVNGTVQAGNGMNGTVEGSN